MKLHSLIEKFVGRMHALNHLLPILPDESLYIRFDCEGESVTLAVSKNGIDWREATDERRLLTIRGSQEAMSTLLQGELKLQQQMRLHELSVSGSFRHMLLLETIFHLSKPYRSVS